MAEIHVTIKNIDASGNQVVFHNPGQHPLPASAGKAVTVTANATTGTAAHGTVANNVSPVIFDNPA